MGDYPHISNNGNLSSFRSNSQIKSLENLEDDRHSYLPKITQGIMSQRNSINYTPVDQSLIHYSVKTQEDVDYFMNDMVRKRSEDAIKSLDRSLPIPEVHETTKHNWENKYEHLKYVQLLEFPSLPINRKRIPLFSKKHDFGPKVGVKHAEISIYKNKVYIGKRL